jgi:hypothetical protein
MPVLSGVHTFYPPVLQLVSSRQPGFLARKALERNDQTRLASAVCELVEQGGIGDPGEGEGKEEVPEIGQRGSKGT